MNQLALDLQPVAPAYREIPLSQNKVAIVDPGDYEALAKFKWQSARNKNSGYFYAIRSFWLPDGRHTTVQMHREILNAPKDLMVDHKNHDTLDNRRQNIRLADRYQNQYNAKTHKGNRAGLKGAQWQCGKWSSRIRCRGVSKFLGYFASAEEAHAAYKIAAAELHGEFACTE